MWEWSWGNYDVANPVTVDHTYRCLTLKSGTGTFSHAHKIVKQLRTGADAVPAARTFETRLNCGEHYKGMIGGWDLTGAANGHTDHFVFEYLYYLGMDPRIKTRRSSGSTRTRTRRRPSPTSSASRTRRP